MIQNKIISIALPILVTTALVGVGFSSWYFGHDNLVTNTKDVSIHTYSDVAKGTLTLLEAPSKIVFSQGSGEVNNTKDGIDFYKEENNAYVSSDKVIVKYTLADSKDSIEGSSFRLYVSFGGTSFSNIVKLTDIYANATETNGGYDFVDDIEEVKTTSEQEPYGYYLYTLNLTNVIEYKSAGSNGVKPIDQDKYNVLQSSLTDASLTINIVAI